MASHQLYEISTIMNPILQMGKMSPKLACDLLPFTQPISGKGV